MGEDSGWDPIGTAKDTDGPQVGVQTRVTRASQIRDARGPEDPQVMPCGVKHRPREALLLWLHFGATLLRKQAWHLSRRDLTHCSEGLTAAQSKGDHSRVSLQAPCSRGLSMPHLHLCKLQEGKACLQYILTDPQKGGKMHPLVMDDWTAPNI